MRKVFGIGETVLDIIFKNNQPIAAVPGGSTFNSIISLGRCGVNTSILTEAGNDRVGLQIKSFMEENGVHSDNLVLLPTKTPVSLAYLNEKNEAEYIFYRSSRESHPDFVYPEINEDDIVLFGSFFALNMAVRHQVAEFLKYAKSKGAILYYDVNFRPSHKKDLGDTGNNLVENYEYADILRGSKDDFVTLYGIDNPDAVLEQTEVGKHCPHFIFTNGSAPIEIRDNGNFAKNYPIPPIETISTIGAGDNFNAGFIYGLVKLGITKKMIHAGLSEAQWDHLLESACEFSSDCCRSIFNYVSPEFGKARVL